MADARSRATWPLLGASRRGRAAPGVLGLVSVLALCVLEPSLWPVGLVCLLLIAAAWWLAPASEPRAADPADPSILGDALPSLSAFDLANAVADPMIVFDRQGIVVHANMAAAHVFGELAPGSMMQLRFRAPELLSLIESAIAGLPAAAAVDHLERFPIERLYKASVARIGQAGGLNVLILRDQSEIRRVDRMRADFIANASHELRTPLASVAGFVETLRGPAKNDEKARDRFLAIMQEQTGRMARLIDDLLSLSRIEMKAMPAPGESTDLTALLAKVVEANAPRAREARVEIVATLPDEPMIVHGDRDELFQVFENLVENACKYGHAGGRVEVDLDRVEDGGQAGIAAVVRDFGAGIATEHIPRITERFYRIEAGDGRVQKGTGLGLSIVKHIVTRHNARLAIRSKLGEGTSFAVFFPDNKQR